MTGRRSWSLVWHAVQRCLCLALLGAGLGGLQLPAAASEGSAARVTEVSVPSAALGWPKGALVYTPPGYTAAQRYPVLYLYHGLRDTKEFWRDLGVFDAATRLILADQLRPLIIVTPSLDNSFGVNNESSVSDAAFPGGPVTFSGGRYEDFLVTELVDFIDARYATLPERGARWVGGISMGGFAALHAAMRHPDRFSRAGGHSPAVIEGDWAWLFPAGLPRESRDIRQLAAGRDLSSLALYLDCGEQDDFGFAAPVRRLADTLRARGVPLQWQLRPGSHGRAYWMAHIEEYLRFYASRP